MRRTLGLLVICLACSGAERTPALAGDSGAGPAAPPPVESYVVNQGVRGLSTRVRWMLSPDSSTILATEDPVGAEADPVPNGFVLASEQAPVLQRDSVWDVAPNPEWTRIAYARAYGSPPGERDSLTAAEWQAFAQRVGLPVDVVRAGAFSTSGMTYAIGTGRPVVIDLAAWRASPVDTVAHAVPMAGAWRV